MDTRAKPFTNVKDMKFEVVTLDGAVSGMVRVEVRI